MSKLEYLDPADWSLHVIDGENEAVPEGWLLVPEGSELYLDNNYFYKLGFPSFVFIGGEWEDVADGFNTVDDFIAIGDSVLWQRESKSEVVEDVVNSPSHYTSGGIECLDAMQAMLSKDEFVGFLRGNIFKYNWRYKMKNGIEDLKKAKFYQEKLIEVEGK